MAKRSRHSKKKDALPSKLDLMMEELKKKDIKFMRGDVFDPKKDLGIGIDEYLADYEPEKMENQFAIGREKKAGRPRKDVRERIREYIHNESLRLSQEMKDQSGVEFNFIRHLLSFPHRKEIVEKKKTKKLERIVPNIEFGYTSKVGGTVNLYEFRGRLKVMERLVQIVEEMEGWGLDAEEYVLLLWWWCKDAIARSHEERDKVSVKNMTVAFEEERRLFGMINQLERVRNRIRHVIVSAKMDYENIRSTRPKVGLVEMMNER